MSDATRRINRVLGRTVGVQITPGRVRAIRLGLSWFSRLLYFDDLFDQVADVPGDIVECGVADGASLAMLASLSRARSDPGPRHCWGFDAWSGLPAPSKVDLAGENSIAIAGMFGYTSRRRVHEELEAYGFNEAEIARSITLVAGYFEETLPRFDREIALLHIDADLYESYRTCLQSLWPKVKSGGVVAFDEYEDAERWPGARRAVDEFLGALPRDAVSLRRHESSGKWWATKLA